MYAVEFSHRSGRDLLNVAKKRTNIIPIIEDARHPHKYRMLVGECLSINIINLLTFSKNNNITQLLQQNTSNYVNCKIKYIMQPYSLSICYCSFKYVQQEADRVCGGVWV